MHVSSHNLIEGHTRDDLQVLSSHAPCALSTTSPSSSQTLDKRELTFSFPLSVTGGLLEAGVGISSTEVAGEVVLTVSVPETMGVMKAGEVTEGPFLVTRAVLFPRLESSSSFFDLILAYMSLLNLVIISAKGKHFFKKKYNEISTDEPNTYSFFLQFQGCVGWR